MDSWSWTFSLIILRGRSQEQRKILSCHLSLYSTLSSSILLRVDEPRGKKSEEMLTPAPPIIPTRRGWSQVNDLHQPELEDMSPPGPAMLLLKDPEGPIAALILSWEITDTIFLSSWFIIEAHLYGSVKAGWWGRKELWHGGGSYNSFHVRRWGTSLREKRSHLKSES